MWKTQITGSVMTDVKIKLWNQNHMCKMGRWVKAHKKIEFLGPLFIKPINSNFQALFKDNCQFSRQIEKSSTFQDRSQIQALFKVCGNHGGDSHGDFRTKDLGPVSISEKTSFRKILWSLEAARFVFRIVRSFWNLTGTSAAVLPMCLSNFKAIWQFKVPISWLRDFTRSYEKTSFRISRRGPAMYAWIHPSINSSFHFILRHKYYLHGVDLSRGFPETSWFLHRDSRLVARGRQRIRHTRPSQKSRNITDDRSHNQLSHIDGLMQQRSNSIANALELRLPCTNPSKWTHDSYHCSLQISLKNMVQK